jgi:putative transposase
MSTCRRYFAPGGTYFFTVVTQGRAGILTTSEARAILHDAFRVCQQRWPFQIDAIVLLPEHLHAIWSLPRGDDRYPLRWAFIKKEFTKGWLQAGGSEKSISPARIGRRRRGVWQPRYWEHLISDEDDFERHLEYIHYNPVKHGLVECPRDWPFSSFHRWVRLGAYETDWGCGCRDAKSFRFDDIEKSAME